MPKDFYPQEVLNEEQIRKVIDAINISKEQLQQHLDERGFSTNNGRQLDRWNYIFNNVEKSFLDEPFKCYKITRTNLWSFIIIYNASSKISYVILREETFHRLKNDDSKLYHYAKELNSINSGNSLVKTIKTKKCQQISFLKQASIMQPSSERIYEDLDNMIYEIKDDVQWCVNILFKEDADGVSSISGNIASYDLDILKTYKWDKYISPTINEISDTKDIENSEVPPIILKVRKETKNSNKKEQEEKNSLVDEKRKADKNKSKK